MSLFGNLLQKLTPAAAKVQSSGQDEASNPHAPKEDLTAYLHRRVEEVMGKPLTSDERNSAVAARQFPIQPAAQESTMADATPAPKQTFLQHLGSILRRALHIGEEIAVVGEPLVAAAYPAIAPLFDSAIGLAMAAEATAATATGTGPQKLAQVVAGLNPLIDKFVKDNGLGDFESANRAKFASAIADALNLIPAPKAS